MQKVLTRPETTARELCFKWQAIISSTPVYSFQLYVSTNRKIFHRSNIDAGFVNVDFLLIAEDFEFIIMDSNAKVEIFPLLKWIRRLFFFTPFAMLENKVRNFREKRPIS